MSTGMRLAVIVAILLPACLMSIDESRIPCDTCGRPDAAADAAVEAGAADAKADVGAGPGAVRCGTSTCASTRPVCCVQTYGDNDYTHGACDTASNCQTGDFFHCTQPIECAGGLSCCIVLQGGGAFTRTECATTCSGSQLCDPAGAPCTGGKVCTSSDMLPGLYECR